MKSRVLRTLMRYLRAYGAIKMLFKHLIRYQYENAAVKNALINNGRLESAMRVFRNAQADQYTGCGADYLTGQEGDDINGRKCIYWTGVSGYRKVILRQINTAYASVKDRRGKSRNLCAAASKKRSTSCWRKRRSS